MKWVVFLALLIAVPVMAALFRQRPALQRPAWFAFGLLPFILPAAPLLDIGLVTRAGWPGHVHGIVFSLHDALVLALLASARPQWGKLAFGKVWAFYFLTVVVSVFVSANWVASVFVVWQVIRVFLVFAVVGLLIRDERTVGALLAGLAAGLFLQSLVVMYQRYGGGVIQTSGLFGHQNSLGMATHFAALPLFALLLAGSRQIWAWIAPAASAIIVVHAASRASIGFEAIGMLMVLAFSILRGFTSRKFLVVVLGIAAVAAAAPLALSSFSQRFDATPLSQDYDERAAFERAALEMWRDNPMGVGANTFVIAANVNGYYAASGVAWTSFRAIVHNAYLLTLAELGVLGLFAFLLLLSAPLLAAFRSGFRYRRDRRADLLIGLGVALIVCYLHMLFEWVFLTYNIQILFAITCGLVAAMAAQLRDDDRASGRISPTKSAL